MATNKENSEYVEDFTPKTANRKINKPLLIGAALVILLAGLAFGAYRIYEGDHYYQTDNAKVDAIIYHLTANASGKLVKMVATQGQRVTAGQVLARVNDGPDIISPVDGTVLDVKMDKGDYANASDVLMDIAKTGDVNITANVEEANILKIHKGQPVSVSLDAYGRSFDGVVDDVSTVTSSKLNGGLTSFTTSGTYTKVTQLLPVKIKLLDAVNLADIIGTNATVKIRIK